MILQASVLNLRHIENIFFTQRLGQGVQRVADFSHVVLENFAVLDDDGRSGGYQPVPRPVFERDLGHEERDAEEHQQRYDDEPMVELIVKRQICRNGAQRDAAHEVMEGHIGYRLLAENSRRDHEEDKSGDCSKNNFHVCLQWTDSLFQFMGAVARLDNNTIDGWSRYYNFSHYGLQRKVIP